MMSIGRAIRRFNAGNSGLKRAVILGSYYGFIVLPHPVRRLAVAGFITVVLWLKRWAGVERQCEPTLRDEIGTLSFWGVPEVDLESFRLTVDGAVRRPRMWRFDELVALPAREVAMRMDCVSGFRNNTMMRGIAVATLLEAVGPTADARRAIFYCADEYYTSSRLEDLGEVGAMLVYEVNGERAAEFGFPLRVAIPGTYGYQWAKWVQRIEIVRHDRKGYWPQRGLPDRARIGDRW